MIVAALERAESGAVSGLGGIEINLNEWARPEWMSEATHRRILREVGDFYRYKVQRARHRESSSDEALDDLFGTESSPTPDPSDDDPQTDIA
jgi:hypothetical protein